VQHALQFHNLVIFMWFPFCQTHSRIGHHLYHETTSIFRTC